ncbi:MAG: glycosyltransferase family 9 protein [Anaerolineae bacterium]|nr:glycosyltransferase family 9 protein [Gemmatimonadaceae bacterium]
MPRKVNWLFPALELLPDSLKGDVGGQPKRILLIQLRRLGDVILTAGLLSDIRRAHSHWEVDFLTSASAEPLLRQHSQISRLIAYDKRHPIRMIRDIRGRQYDWVIDVQSNPRTAVLTGASGAQVRAGWDIGFWSWVYTHTLPRSGGRTVYVLRERQRFLELLNVPVGSPTTRLEITDQERSRAEELIAAAQVPLDVPRVGMVLSVTEPVRQWPVERFGELAAALALEGVVPLVMQNPGDAPVVARLRSLCPSVAIVPTADLRTLMATIASCSVFVSGDTGPAHMATALGVPRVTIYGPTDPDAWNPGLPTTIIVRDPAASIMRTKDWASAGEHAGITGVSSATVLENVRGLLRASHQASIMNTGR